MGTKLDKGNRADKFALWLLREVEGSKAKGVPYVFNTREINFEAQGARYTEPALDIDRFKSILRSVDSDFSIVADSGGLWKVTIRSFDMDKLETLTAPR